MCGYWSAKYAHAANHNHYTHSSTHGLAYGHSAARQRWVCTLCPYAKPCNTLRKERTKQCTPLQVPIAVLAANVCRCLKEAVSLHITQCALSFSTFSWTADIMAGWLVDLMVKGLMQCMQNCHAGQCMYHANCTATAGM